MVLTVVLVLVLVAVVGGGIFAFQEIQLSLFQRISQISLVVVVSLHFCSVLRVVVQIVVVAIVVVIVVVVVVDVVIVVVVVVAVVVVVVVVVVFHLDVDMNISCHFYTSAGSVYVSVVALSCFPMAYL